MSDPVQLLSAGSMRHAFPAIVMAFKQQSGIAVSLSLGPAGLLRERIEAGEPFDLFASANMEHPLRLAFAGIVEDVICFARNRLCVLARADLGLTTENFLHILGEPMVKIGISTPGDDPSGDYAFDVFDRIGKIQKGMDETLKARARQLVGGRDSPPMPPGKGVGHLIAEGVADLFLSYYSGARMLEEDPAFNVVEIPRQFAPTIEYGLALRKDASDDARRLRGFIMSDQGQAILKSFGFLAVE